jgi:hypothetical protein
MPQHTTMVGPKILFLDIETTSILANVYRLFKENISIKHIIDDSFILSWAAKWKHEDTIYYEDIRHTKELKPIRPGIWTLYHTDISILPGIWKLIDEADIIIGHNIKQFDTKVLNQRFITNNMQEPSSVKQIDTLQMAKAKFRFTSNKLEFLVRKLCPEQLKSDHNKFPGQELWNECLNGNFEAWDEMEHYNKQDVVATEALYNKLEPWGKGSNSYDPNVYHQGTENICKCGQSRWIKNGTTAKGAQVYQRYKCYNCGHERHGPHGLLSKEKTSTLLKE